jgi:hypothetical protein
MTTKGKPRDRIEQLSWSNSKNNWVSSFKHPKQNRRLEPAERAGGKSYDVRYQRQSQPAINAAKGPEVDQRHGQAV